MSRFIVVLLTTGILTAVTVVYPENPPVAHTGGFGEPTCHACHFDGDLNDGLADLSILGIDSTYQPDQNYALRVILKRTGMARAGFQLSIRDDKGLQAGMLTSDNEQVAIDDAGGVQYIRHTREGAIVDAPDSIAWVIGWKAPDSSKALHIHLTANAANGDESEFGDATYQIERILKSNQ